jgi:hypothetical protein
MATPEQITDAQLLALKAETQQAQDSTLRHVSHLATLIMCDKHTTTGRGPAAVTAAVDEAVAIWAGVVAKMRDPALYGQAS